MAAIADELARARVPSSALAIRTAISGVTHSQPRDSDVERVRARLAAGGWPPAKPKLLS